MKWYSVDDEGNTHEANLPCEVALGCGGSCPVCIKGRVNSINYLDRTFKCTNSVHPLPDKWVDTEYGRPVIKWL